MEENTITIEAGIEGGRIYELAYLLVPTLEGEAVDEKFQSLKSYLVTKGAEMVSEDTPRLIELQYEMSRTIANKKTWFDEAHFGWVKFDADPVLVKEIHDDLARDEQVIRFMIIKTVKENTIASKKPLGGLRHRKDIFAKEGNDTEIVESEKATVEEVDKAVDALVDEA
jgi:ribosomal protein S6